MAPDDPTSKSTALRYKTPGIRSTANIGRRRSMSCLNRSDGWPRVYVRVLLKPESRLQIGANNFGFLFFACFSFRFVRFWSIFWPNFRDAWGRTPLWNSLPTFSHWLFQTAFWRKSDHVKRVPLCFEEDINLLAPELFFFYFSTPCI